MVLERRTEHLILRVARRRAWRRVVVVGVAAVSLASGGAAWSLFTTAAKQSDGFTGGSITAASGLGVSALTSTSAVLSWSPPAGYTPTRWTLTQSAGTQTGCTGNDPTSGCEVTGLSVGTTYTWVLAYFDGGWQAQTSVSAKTLPRSLAVSVTTANGGSAGTIDAGDRVIFTFSQTMDPSTFLPGFTGASTPVGICITSAHPNVLAVTTGSCDDPSTVSLGTVSLGTNDYVSGSPWAQWPATMAFNGAHTVLTVTLTDGCTLTSSSDCATVTAPVSDATQFVWTPSTLASDTGGTAMSATAVASSLVEHF